MPSEMMFTTETYGDGVKIPWNRYKCKAEQVVVPKVELERRVPVTHHCKVVVDHTEEDHVCVCGRTWPNVGKKDKETVNG